eukprot:6188790-Pleurochrysis_carterae.AAC.3
MGTVRDFTAVWSCSFTGRSPSFQASLALALALAERVGAGVAFNGGATHAGQPLLASSARGGAAQGLDDVTPTAMMIS